MGFHAGATLDRFPGAKYSGSLHFAELALRAPRPRAATLRKIRRAAPAELRIALVLGRDQTLDPSGTMKADALRDALVWVREAATAVGACAIVVPTGREVSPGARDRDRLLAFVEALGRAPERAIVWDPRGLWERDAAATFAARNELLLAFDPLVDPAPAGPVGYARIAAIGVRSRLSTGLLERTVSVVRAAGYEEAYVAIDSSRSYRDARSLAGLYAGSAHEDERDLEDLLSLDDDE